MEETPGLKSYIHNNTTYKESKGKEDHVRLNNCYFMFSSITIMFYVGNSKWLYYTTHKTAQSASVIYTQCMAVKVGET